MPGLDESRPRIGSAAFYRDLATAPNLLCISRIVVFAVAMWAFFSAHYVIAFTLGLISGLTDYVDGYVARKYHMVTELGALLDQVVDLLYAFCCIATLAHLGVWPMYLLFAWGFRDITILTVRLSAAQQGFAIPSVIIGKAATNFLFYSFIFGFFQLAEARGADLGWLSPIAHFLGPFSVHVGLGLQWASAFIYIRRYVQSYRSSP